MKTQEEKREYWREKTRQWRAKHGQSEDYKAKKKASDERCKARVVSYGRRYRIGVEPDAFREMWSAQQGLCAICADALVEGKNVAADHCHRSGRFRGILCMACNAGVGFFDDSLEFLHAAVAYLKRSQCREST